MSAKQPRPLSRCANCGGAYRDHVALGGASLGCPLVANGQEPSVWQPPIKKATLRRSLSFSPAEVDALQDLLFAVHRRDTRKALAVTVSRESALTAVLGRLQK